MPSSSRPRKQYRPKPIGRPVMDRMRNDLVLPAYSALSVLQLSNDAEALESARHTLAACCNYVGLLVRGDDRRTVVRALDAIRSMDARHERTRTYRTTGDELAALRHAVNVCDVLLPTFRTDEIARALLVVDAAMAVMEEA